MLLRSTLLFCCGILLFSSCRSTKAPTPPRDPTGTLWAARFSFDNQLLAVGGEAGEVLLFQTSDFSLIERYQIGAPVFRLSWHPHQLVLAVASMEGHACLLDIANSSKTILPEVNEGTRAIDWNRSGEFLASANYGKSITIWNEGGELLRNLPNAAEKSFVGIDWHPQWDELITLSESIQRFDPDGQLLQRWMHRPEEVLMLCVQWHPDGEYFVVGDYGDTQVPHTPLLQWWNAEGQLFHSSDVSNAEFRNIRWSPDGQLLATASDALRIWSPDGELLIERPTEDLLWGIDWSTNGQFIVTSSETGRITLWDAGGELLFELRH